MKEYLFTSESVTEGHPDKMADQISDAILDYIITRDPDAHVACETLVSNGFCVVAGELKTNTYVPIQEVVRGVVQKIGYNNADFGFDYKSAAVLNGIGEQSVDIDMGVTQEDGEIGAGDQGLMFGYACDETPELMPLAISLSHKLTMKLAEVRKNGTLPYLRPDGKSQVTVKYVDDVPVYVDTIVISTQHNPEITLEQIKKDVTEYVIKACIPEKYMGTKTIIHVNPTGRFVVGGPQGDAGLTGRKIIVDTYGGSCPHGGGAFCFTGDTPVKTSNGYKNIKDITPGDVVYTINEDTNNIELKEVNKTVINESYEDDLLEVELENGEIIRVTGNHEINTINGWVRAKDLVIGSDLTTLK